MRLLLLLLFPATLHAQIYADFTVSSGGSPLGTFRVLLEHEKAPRTCANFIGLASGKRSWIDMTNGAVRTDTPYYDGLIFHRLIHSFVIQGGSPTGLGNGSPGYAILDEFHPDLRHSSQYFLSMAKSSFPNTGGSQFFITLRATPELNDKHSVFGTVISGTEMIDGFRNSTNFPTGAGDKPVTPIVMDSVIISGPDFEAFDLNDPALRLPYVGGTEMEITRNATAETMTATFDRRPQIEYLFLESPDLAVWENPRHILSLDSASGQTLTIGSRPESSYFLNLATIRYDKIPNAPADLLAGRTLRVKFTNGNHLDLGFDGTSGGSWYDSGGDRTAAIASTTWTDQAGETGIVETTLSAARAIPLGRLDTTLVDYFAPGDLRLVTWLSFHTETTGWLEETPGGPVNRFAFEILSN